MDLIHEYAYTYDVITDMDKELDRLTETVNGIISRRNEQISIVLSLVATVFLPLTFIAGVFGMNFSNGGILVHVLHMNNGTTVFWISCVICVLYCFSVFIAKVRIASHMMLSCIHTIPCSMAPSLCSPHYSLYLVCLTSPTFLLFPFTLSR